MSEVRDRCRRTGSVGAGRGMTVPNVTSVDALHLGSMHAIEDPTTVYLMDCSVYL